LNPKIYKYHIFVKTSNLNFQYESALASLGKKFSKKIILTEIIRLNKLENK